MTTPLDYPLPESAAYIWTNGDKIFLTFPGYEGTESRRFNTVTLNPQDHPRCKCGAHVKSHVLSTLFEVLRARARATKPEARKIASPATLTQAQLEMALKRARAKRPTAEDKAQALLAKLGMTADELLTVVGIKKP